MVIFYSYVSSPEGKPMRLLRQSHISTISADQHHDEEIWLCSQPPTDTDHSTVTCRHHARDVEPACNFQKITQGHNVRMAVAALTVQPMHCMKSFHQIGQAILGKWEVFKFTAHL